MINLERGPRRSAPKDGFGLNRLPRQFGPMGFDGLFASVYVERPRVACGRGNVARQGNRLDVAGVPPLDSGITRPRSANHEWANPQ